MARPKIRTVMIHAADSKRAVAFWSEFMELTPLESDGQFTWLKQSEGDHLRIAVQQSESPLLPNATVHPDIEVEDLDLATARIETLGGTLVKANKMASGFEWRVMADTEGNHFCIFTAH